jgi:chemotaxis protein methyltransferase CheR
MASPMNESTSRRHDMPVPTGEFPFTWSDFRQIAELVHSESGIVLADSKVNLVYSRLAKRLRAIGLKTFREYCALVDGEEGVDERQAMIAAMTTNVTRFFREPHHFDYLRDEVLPDLAAAARSGRRVRIWSAGCSSGEEPYSIALTILSEMPDIANHDFIILASDLDHTMVERGRSGIYDAKLVESIPPNLRGRFLEPVQEKGGIAYRMAEHVRALVRFNKLNLLGSWPMKGRFDVIFCRNTMIYFDEPTQNSIWKRFGEILVPGAPLLIGHSERIATEQHPFDLVAQTTYRLRSGGRR